MKQIYFAIAMAIVLTTAANAQPFEVLKDIKLGMGDGVSEGTAPNFTKMNGALYFVANDGVTGPELWKSNGTAAGTVLVKDIQPGSFGSNAHDLTVVGNIIYFWAATDAYGFELWKTDGTTAGTKLVKDINVGGVGNPQYLTAIGNTLYFAADDGIHGTELWKTDGTEAGTVMVKDIYPGSNPGPNNSNPTFLTRVGNKIYFMATLFPYGAELWKTDGTEAGTVMVKDINPGKPGSDMRDLINIDGALFFVASPPGESLTLMRSNGTEEGTVVIKPGLDGVVDLVDMDGTVCFAAAGGELWKSNGTEYGTELIKDIHPDDLIIKRILTITRVNSRVFFSGDDGIHGHELWISDGTCDGTKLVKDILPGNMGSSPDVRNMYAADNILLFKPDDGIDGRELWRSDGTCEGTYMVQDLYPGSVSSEPNEIIRIGDKVYISARDVSKGFELWSGKLKKKSYFGKGADSDITDEIQEAPIKTGLYPNPVRENATLSVYATRQGKTSYSIIDQNGKTVQTKSIILNKGNNIISIETRSFSSGVYSIVLNNGGRMEQVRFIKQ